MIIEIKLDVEKENELEIDYMGNCGCGCGCGKELFSGMTVVNFDNKMIYCGCLQNALENRKVVL